MYCESPYLIDGIIRYGTPIQKSIGNKINEKNNLSTWLVHNSQNRIYFKNTSGAAYKPFFSNPPFFEVNGERVLSKTIDMLSFRTKEQAKSSIALFNSNLFNFLFCTVSDARHTTHRELNLLRVDDALEQDTELHHLSRRLENDYHNNSIIVTYNKKNGITKYAQFNPRLSKPILDEIDTVLARHYGFTDEELDFILNYDIKYRMSDESNNSEE